MTAPIKAEAIFARTSIKFRIFAKRENVSPKSNKRETTVKKREFANFRFNQRFPVLLEIYYIPVIVDRVSDVSLALTN